MKKILIMSMLLCVSMQCYAMDSLDRARYERDAQWEAHYRAEAANQAHYRYMEAASRVPRQPYVSPIGTTQERPSGYVVEKPLPLKGIYAYNSYGW